MHFVQKGSKRGGHGHSSGGSMRYKTTPGYIYAWVWSCCNCGLQGGMSVESEQCPEFACGHTRCIECHLEQIKLPRDGSASVASSSSGKILSGDRHPPIENATESTHQLPAAPLNGSDGTENSALLCNTNLSSATSQAMSSNPNTDSPSNKCMNAEPSPSDLAESHLTLESTRTPVQADLLGHESLFAPRSVGDAALLDHWHKTVLPNIASSPDKYEGLKSMHLFRRGITEEHSFPTILATVERQDVDDDLREEILALFQEPIRSSLQISFEQASLRRTVKNLPPICNARNTSFQKYPMGGASIGIKDRVDSTATLGGFLMVDGRAHLLTVDHLLPEETENPPPIYITHPSAQEGYKSSQWLRVDNCFPKLALCCPPCCELYEDHRRDKAFYKPLSLYRIGKICRNTREFKLSKTEFWYDYPCQTLGMVSFRSQTRSRLSLEDRELRLVEMDWALVTIDAWPDPLESHIQEISEGLNFSSIIPGQFVKSTGRTSGHQTGQINTALSIARHGTRFTQEWSVLKDPECDLKDWIEGGIGVDGDSGAWIIDRHTGALYGMAWARDGISEPICLFSPIHDIVADIKERTGAKTVCLPRHGETPLALDKGKKVEDCTVELSPIVPHHRQSQEGCSGMILSKHLDSTASKSLC